MPQFAYIAVEPRTGRERRGSLASPSREQAVKELRSRGLATTALVLDGRTGIGLSAGKLSGDPVIGSRQASTPSGGSNRWMPGRTVGRKELTLFTRQFATLVLAGVPLLRALEIIARPEQNRRFREVLSGLAEAIRQGGNLSAGLRQHPRVFDALYVNMVRAGEAGVALGVVLERLARLRERTDRIKGRVKAALAYPAILLVVSGGILTGLMAFVVPRFEQIYHGLLKGRPLPPLTRGLIGAGHFAGQHFALVLGGVGLGWLGWHLVRKADWGSRFIDDGLLRLPVLGGLQRKAIIARLVRALGSLLASDVPMLDALVIARDTSGRGSIARALGAVHDRVREGATVASSLAATAVFPAMVTGMIEVGEETGALPAMLARIADAYDEDVDNAVAALTATIEPLMIVFMACIVGLMVVALFLPIVGIIQHLQ